eukprot:CAMPEP_0114559414 /NCGR_PEP_ID=MMETSP0114-20121206/10908_1 /TAXON_ID=31324 /ORGANISM="Goniomonas sp, Strain m" /LENGTH=163 /DNA_ID=CAMNT_0001744881 /DNA_START=11 /DNA_END=502 /DNA_ORIENTATION=+
MPGGGSKLGRFTTHRWAMLRNMVTSLIRHERIETTLPRAKELRKVADNMVTLAKRGDLHARRQAAKVLYDKEMLRKLFTVFGERYQDRHGGYTRVLRSRYRQGDQALMAHIEYIDREGEMRTPKPPAPPGQPEFPLPPLCSVYHGHPRKPKKPKAIKDADQTE